MRKIMIELPKSWQELNDAQLYYVYGLMVENLSVTQIKTTCLLKWGGLKVVAETDRGYEMKCGGERFEATRDAIAAATWRLDWIGALPTSPVRLSKIGGHRGVDGAMMGVEFEKYLYCDNLYYGYLETQDDGLLAEMAGVLYGKGGIKVNQVERISIFYWWVGLKSLMSRSFPTFLQPMAEGMEGVFDGNVGKRLQESMNGQIRALTKGDVTKEKEVLAMDTWRALTELEAQAKDYEEIKSKYGNKT